MGQKQVYVSEDERRKCKRVIDAFEEFFNELQDKEDCIVAVDAGGYGYVLLQYYKPGSGFENCSTYTDSMELFEDLWDEWLGTTLLRLTKGTALEEERFEDMFKALPRDKQKELQDKHIYFARNAGVNMEEITNDYS